MKLNKTELNALTDKIGNELRKLGEQKQKELNAIQDVQNRPAAVLAVKATKTMNKTLYSFLCDKFRDPARITVDEVVKHLRKDQTEVVIPQRHSNDGIFSALVIAQIDCPDIETMIEKVKAPFIKI